MAMVEMKANVYHSLTAYSVTINTLVMVFTKKAVGARATTCTEFVIFGHCFEIYARR